MRCDAVRKDATRVHPSGPLGWQLPGSVPRELCKAMPSATTSVRYNPPAASTAPSHTAPFSDHQLADLVSGVAVMVSGSLGQGVGPKAQAAPKSRLAQGATKGESGEGAARTTLVTAAPQSPWGDVLSSWLSAVHWHTQARLPFFTYRDLTRMLLAFRKMGHQLPHSWLAALRYRDLRTASAYDLLVILQTMAFFDHKPPSHWLWSFCLATLTCGPHSPLEEGGYAQDSITLDEDGSVADMAKGLGLQGWTVLELVELMRALADLGAKPSNQWVLEWLSAAELELGTCNPQLCLQMLGSLERLHITPPQQWTTNLIEYGLRPHVTAQKLTIQQVAQVMRGLNKACYVPSEDFLSALLKFSPQALANIFRALVTLKAPLTPAWIETYADEVANCMGLFYFSEPEASMLVCAMCESDTLPSAQTLARLAVEARRSFPSSRQISDRAGELRDLAALMKSSERNPRGLQTSSTRPRHCSKPEYSLVNLGPGHRPCRGTQLLTPSFKHAAKGVCGRMGHVACACDWGLGRMHAGEVLPTEVDNKTVLM
eukprot:gene32430-31016_t